MIEKFIENGLHSYDSGIAHEDKNPRYYSTIPSMKVEKRLIN